MKHRKDWCSHQKRHTVILKKMCSWHLHFHQNRAEVGESLNLDTGLQENYARQAGSGQLADEVECAEGVPPGGVCGDSLGPEQTWPA